MPETLATMAPRMAAAVAARNTEAGMLLETLVNMDTCSRAVPALTEASRRIESELKSLGFEVERHDFPAHGPVLVGRLSGQGRHRVLLLAHYDTVFEAGEPSRRPYRADGMRAYGPGVADMKGGIVTLWEALRALRAAGWDGFKTLTVIHNADEEIGSPASRPLIETEGRTADFCLVQEPGRPDGSVVTARKGIGHFSLTVNGRAAHAGSAPQDGASAVVALAHKILALHRMNDYARGLTVNSIITRGGTRANIVPDEATAEIDLRIPTTASGQEAVAKIEAIARREDLPLTTATLAGGIDRPPFEAGPEGAALLRIAQEAAAALGFALRDTAAGGVSDGNFLAAMGVPVLDGLGACGGNYHNRDEYLDLASLPRRAAVNALILWEACRREAFLRGAG